MNVNQQMLRPVLQNVTILLLFVLPAITMRTYAEERRSGTIELLLTSPVSDFQIIMGKFLGALALYAVMLAVTLVHNGVLFLYGRPEWKPILTSYLGLMLLGGSFLSVGLFISTLTTNQIVAYIVTFSTFLLLWVISWIGSISSGMVHRPHLVSVDHRALRRLHEGRHRHDARHLLLEPDYVWAVPDRQVGRHRTVAGLMVNRIFSFIGWLGTALVLGAVGIRFFLPARDQYATYLAWAGLVCMVLYIASQWREIARLLQDTRRRATARSPRSSVFIALGILVAINYIGKRENKRWDLTASKQFSLSDQSRNYRLQARRAARTSTSSRRTLNFPAVSRSAEGIRVRVEAGEDRVHRSGSRIRRSRSRYKVEQYGTIVFEYKGRTERVTSNTEQDITNGIIKVVSGQQKKVYFTDGHGEKDTASSERDGYAPSSRRLAARTTPPTSWCSPRRARCLTTRRWWWSRDRRAISSRRKSTR